MFAWHETTRRLFCRGTFWLLGVLPALAIAAGAYGLRTDSVRSACQELLALQLGVEVRCQQVTFPQPWQVRYVGVELIDPETAAVLARAEAANITRHQQLITIELRQAAVAEGQLATVYDLAQRTLRSGKPGGRIRVMADELKLALADGKGLQCEHLRGQWDFTADAAQVLVEFTPVRRQASSPVSLRVVRNRQTTPASIGFELNTGKTSLPAELASVLLPPAATLGAACEFGGVAWGVLTPTGWNGELRGTFANASLEHVTAAALGRSLTGMATMHIESARLTEGCLTRLRGTLAANDGAIDAGLVQRLATRWGLQIALPQLPLGDHTFSELAASFDLSPAGLQLAGACQTGEAGTLLVDRQGTPLLRSEAPKQLSVAALESVITESREPLLGVLPMRDPTQRLR